MNKYEIRMTPEEDMTPVYVLCAALIGYTASGNSPEKAAQLAFDAAREIGKLIDEATNEADV
jgi:hypothetical protein